ncbi:hypothetical protein [Arhodomonas sp. SL1]|uniref:hypothetical protein n=1 Tax=Arhodomonas sp. SL1 TaxID=3425691 RepID=UPI003F885678
MTGETTMRKRCDIPHSGQSLRPLVNGKTVSLVAVLDWRGRRIDHYEAIWDETAISPLADDEDLDPNDIEQLERLPGRKLRDGVGWLESGHIEPPLIPEDLVLIAGADVLAGADSTTATGVYVSPWLGDVWLAITADDGYCYARRLPTWPNRRSARRAARAAGAGEVMLVRLGEGVWIWI